MPSLPCECAILLLISWRSTSQLTVFRGFTHRGASGSVSLLGSLPPPQSKKRVVAFTVPITKEALQDDYDDEYVKKEIPKQKDNKGASLCDILSPPKNVSSNKRLKTEKTVSPMSSGFATSYTEETVVSGTKKISSGNGSNRIRTLQRPHVAPSVSASQQQEETRSATTHLPRPNIPTCLLPSQWPFSKFDFQPAGSCFQLTAYHSSLAVDCQ